MFTFLISDKGKLFKFNGRSYKTPCRVFVEMRKQVDILREILTKNSITKVEVQNKNKMGKTQIGSIKSDSLSLSFTIGNK